MSERKQRREIDRAMDHLVGYLEKQTRWQILFREFMDEMFELTARMEGLDGEDAERAILHSDFGEMAFAYLFEEFASVTWVDTDQEGSLIDDYLERRGWREGVHGKRYLQALNRSGLVYWEVTDVRPGAWVDIREHGTDKKPIRVKERSGSESIRPWDGLMARVLKFGGERMFAGGLLSLPAQQKAVVDSLMGNLSDRIRQSFEALVADGELDALPNNLDDILAEEVHDQTPMIIFTAWAVMILRASSSRRPQIRTFDDEALHPSTVHWPITGDRDTLALRLNACAQLSPRDDDHWTWHGSKAPTAAGERILGFVRLGNTLELETLSSERCAQGQQLIDDCVGESSGDPLIGSPLTQLTSFDGEGSEPSGLSPLDPSEHPELEAIVHAQLTQHYRETLDAPVPMLGNRTPRDCAADPDLRPQVIDWLKTLENTDARSPSSNYDMRWLWDELNIDRELP